MFGDRRWRSARYHSPVVPVAAEPAATQVMDRVPTETINSGKRGLCCSSRFEVPQTVNSRHAQVAHGTAGCDGAGIAPALALPRLGGPPTTTRGRCCGAPSHQADGRSDQDGVCGDARRVAARNGYRVAPTRALTGGRDGANKRDPMRFGRHTAKSRHTSRGGRRFYSEGVGRYAVPRSGRCAARATERSRVRQFSPASWRTRQSTRRR